MKAEHILLLVLAGAVGGAGLMKVIQKPQPVRATLVRPVKQVAVMTPPPSTPAPAPLPEPVPDVSQQATQNEPLREEPPAPLVREIKPRVHPDRTYRYTPHFIERAPMVVAKPAPLVAQAQRRAEPVTAPPAPSPAVEEPKPAPTVVQQEPAPAPPPPPPPAAPQPPTVTLTTGMLIPVRLLDGLASDRNSPGDTFLATLDRELIADGFVIAERGARVEGRVVSANRGAVSIELTRLHTSDGQRVPIRTDTFEKRTEPTLLTETRLSFRLSHPITLTEKQ